MRIYVGALTRTLCLLTCVVCSFSAASAQTVNGSISGVVSDPSGAVVAGATVKATNLVTGVSREATSSDNGTYNLPDLPPGEYRVDVERSGFQTQQYENIQVQVNLARTLDISLQVGSVAAGVTVVDEPPALNKTEATIATVVNSKETVDLPLNGRQFTQLILLAPGAAPVGAGQQGVFTISVGGGGISPAVNGQRPQSNNFTLDGVENNMRFTNAWAVSPPPDAIQEFAVQTHITDPKFSLASGANVNVVTRPGGEEFHGALWEFVRNDRFAAKNFFDNFFGREKPSYRQNQYGFFVGGPVYIPKILPRSQTWFSTYYEGFKSRRGLTQAASVPTAAERAGNFSALLGAQVGTDSLGRPILANQLYNPFTTRPDPNNLNNLIRDPFPGNIIPASLLDARAVAIINALYPAPNTAGLVNNLLTTGSRSIDSDQFGVRVDHRFPNNDTLFGRFSMSDTQQSTPGALPLNSSDQTNKAKNVAITYTHAFNPSTLLTFVFGYNRAGIPFFNRGLGEDFASAVGTTLAPEIGGFRLPASLSFVGGRRTPTSFQYFDLGNPDLSYQYNTDFTKVAGEHTVSAGFHLMRWRHIVGPQGSQSIIFDPRTTGLPGNGQTGDAFAAFLLGLPNSTANQFLDPAQSYGNIYNAYAQDKWNVTRRLSLSLGLQYFYVQPPRAKDNLASIFDYFTGTYLFAGTNPITGEPPNAEPGIVDSSKLNFAPRVALGYQLSDSTVVRAGFGRFFEAGTNLIQNSIRVGFGSYPYGVVQQTSGQNLGVPGPTTLANPYPPPAGLLPTPRNTVNQKTIGLLPFSYQWNVGIQQGLFLDSVLTLEYVGSSNHRMPINYAANLAPAGPGPIAPRRRPFPNAGTFFFLTNDGNSNYNALQAKLEKRFSRGLTFRVSYTYSKSIDLQSDPNSADIDYLYDLRLSRGPSNYDITHLGVISYVYELPFGRGNRFLASDSRLVNALVGGWQVSGVTALRSGLPFSVFVPGDNQNTGQILSTNRATAIKDPTPSGFNQTREQWFDTTAFVVPPLGTIGNTSRNAFRGPGSINFDIVAAKNFRFAESMNLQLRAEFFNAFNNVNFGLPTAIVGNPNFGRIFSAASGRDIQFAIKFNF